MVAKDRTKSQVKVCVTITRSRDCHCEIGALLHGHSGTRAETRMPFMLEMLCNMNIQLSLLAIDRSEMNAERTGDCAYACKMHAISLSIESNLDRWLQSS